MSWTDEISLTLVNDIKKTITVFIINFEVLGFENIRIYITEDGTGIEHELIELDLVRVVMKTHPDVLNYPWDMSKALFHYCTGLFLEDLEKE